MKNTLKIFIINLMIILCSLPQFLSAQNNALFDSAYLAYENSEYEKAIDLFNQIEDDQKNNKEYFLFRGICYSESGNDVRAITNYNNAIELDSTYADAFNMRGFSFFSQGNNFLAINDFDKAIELNPKLTEAYMNRASAKYDDGDFDGACVDWKAANKMGLGIAQQIIEQLCKP